jgi:hypothetical protein
MLAKRARKIQSLIQWLKLFALFNQHLPKIFEIREARFVDCMRRRIEIWEEIKVAISSFWNRWDEDLRVNLSNFILQAFRIQTLESVVILEGFFSPFRSREKIEQRKKTIEIHLDEFSSEILWSKVFCRRRCAILNNEVSRKSVYAYCPSFDTGCTFQVQIKQLGLKQVSWQNNESTYWHGSGRSM